MQQLFQKMFQRIFNHSPSHLLLFELISLFFRFRKVEKELESLQAELWLINQQHDNQLLKGVESRLFGLLQTINRGNQLVDTKSAITGNNMEEHKLLDGLIEPLCELLANEGFFTIASCSGHVAVTKVTQNHYWEKENWYILFTSQNKLSSLNNVIRELELEGISLSLNSFKKEDEDYPFPVYKLSASLRGNLGNYNDQDLFNFNKKVFLTFKKNI